MLIFAVDHEPTMLRDSGRAIRKAAPEAEVMCFELAADALAAIRDRGLSPDIVFSDIEMPGASGLEFAVALKTASPDTRVVFVTAFSQYALDAFRVRAQGYIMKPLTPELVREELNELPAAPKQQANRLRVQCFGSFEVFWQGEPLKFARRQTKELLAYLIDRKGAACTSEELVSALWGDSSGRKDAKHGIRNLVCDLRETFKQIGMEDVLIRRGAHIAIRPELLDCDYYRMLAGDMAAVNAFRGEYMSNYSWAELTAGTLYFHELT
jgi:two-component SAPR family response regulator